MFYLKQESSEGVYTIHECFESYDVYYNTSTLKYKCNKDIVIKVYRNNAAKITDYIVNQGGFVQVLNSKGEVFQIIDNT